jgi:carbonic anhydrase
MINADEALMRLIEGNRRFRSGEGYHIDIAGLLRSQLSKEQDPFAIVLGCSDSRVPAEIIFGQGVGDLFVIRVAGNIVAPSQVGSIEFAAENFGTRLVVVLGHSQCGAIAATLEQLRQPSASRCPNLHAVVDRIRPAVEPLLGSSEAETAEDLLDQAVRANIDTSVDNLRHGSALLESLIEDDGLVIVGAEYCLETGVVDFIE